MVRDLRILVTNTERLQLCLDEHTRINFEIWSYPQTMCRTPMKDTCQIIELSICEYNKRLKQKHRPRKQDDKNKTDNENLRPTNMATHRQR